MNNKPWLNTTGSRTQQGKAQSAQNAYKHGRRALKAIRDQRRSWGRARLISAAMALDGAELAYLTAVQRHLANGQTVPRAVTEKCQQRRGEALLRILKNVMHLVRQGEAEGLGAAFLEMFQQVLQRPHEDAPSLFSQARQVRLVGSDPDRLRVVPLVTGPPER